MGIIRNRLARDFSMIPNQIITDIRVSIGARLLFCYLSSKPDNWQFWNHDMAKQLGIKDEKTISKYLKELINADWVERNRNADKQGKFTGGYEYVLNNPYMEKNHITKKPIYGKNGDYNNNDFYNNTNLENNTNYTEDENIVDNATDIYEDGFEKFWSKYPKHIAKQTAKKAYVSAIKNKKTTHDEIMKGLNNYLTQIKHNKTELQFIKYPSTWLNGGCWNDEYEVSKNKKGLLW